MGGEPNPVDDDGNPVEGLSPRGRGTREVSNVRLWPIRSIPAWAGNPGQKGPPRAKVWVYPRVGGEPGVMLAGSVCRVGLSPRGRGTHETSSLHRSGTRSIPAWAGNPVLTDMGYTLVQVYPRVGGEPVRVKANLIGAKGLSPRGRGTPWVDTRLSPNCRSIPAWAGNPTRPRRCPGEMWVYPRVGGEPVHLVNGP